MNLTDTEICCPKQRDNEELLLVKMISFVVKEEGKAKQLTQKLLDAFSTLGNVMYADRYKLSMVIPNEEEMLEILDLFKQLVTSILHFRIQRTDIISSRDQLIDYLKFKLGGLNVEQCRVLYLNKKNILLADEIISEGTLDMVFFHPREIVKVALFYGASSIIVVHNHPSGDPKASANDLIVTDKIIRACGVFDISVHDDHIIVSKGAYFSCLS